MLSSFLIFVAFVVVVVFPVSSDGSFACAAKCHCKIDDVVDCSHAGLTEVPYGIPKTVRTLHLEANNITSIKRTTFDSFFHLEALYLDRNPIQKYETYPFGMLINMKQLVLSMPRIDNSILHGMERLEYLEIHGEKSIVALNQKVFVTFGSSLRYLGIHNTGITNVDRVIFQHLPLLAELNLTRNKIAHFDSTKMGIGKLQSLDLSYNEITKLSLSGMKQLTHLNGENNMIQKLELEELPVLTKINLSNNHIQKYNFSLPNVEVLDLKFNQIDQFHIQKCMRTLDLSHNPLKNFTTLKSKPCFLKKLKLRNVTLEQLDLTQLNAKVLDLAHNRGLHSLNLSESYQDLAMRDIDMSYCDLNSIHPLFLKGNHLERLKLDNNQISTSNSTSLVISVTASHIDLSNNFISKLKFASPSAVYDVVNLSSNTITSVQTDGHITINKLILASNGLSQKLFKLERVDTVKLDLSHNKFKVFNSRSFFGSSGTFDLQELDLSYNEIEIIKHDNLFGLQYMTSLNLDHNLIKTIEEFSFQHMFELTHLSLEANQLQKPPFNMKLMRHLSYLSLKNNSINKLTADFFNDMGIVAFPTIDLSLNQIPCECEWLTAFQAAFNTHLSIDILGNCSYKGNQHKIDLIPHYDTVEVVDIFGCTQCSMHHCSYRGNCNVHNKTAQPTCQCYQGFSGELCEFSKPECFNDVCKVCNETYCAHGGQCIEMSNSPAHCQCRTGYEGEKCEWKITHTNECDKCMHNSTCTIDANYGERHMMDDHHNIGDDGHTHNTDVVTLHNANHDVGNYDKIHNGDTICHCQHGYKGIYCEMEEFVNCNGHHHCSGRGKCMMGVADSRVLCSCADGWRGSSCQTAVSAAASKSGLSASNVAVIVLALLLVVAAIVLFYVVRKHRSSFGSKLRGDDQYALGDDF